jgi:hypothetical protein
MLGVVVIIVVFRFILKQLIPKLKENVLNMNKTKKSPLFLSHLSVSLLFLTVILIINISIVLIYQSFRIRFDVFFYLELILLILEIKKPTKILSLGNRHCISVLRLTKKFLNILMIVKKSSCLFSKLFDS